MDTTLARMAGDAILVLGTLNAAMEERFFSDHWYRICPIKVALHPHIRLERRRSPAPAHYILFDPLSGKTHQLSVTAALFVIRMDGTASIGDIWDGLIADLGQEAPSQDDVVRLISQLHAADLVRGNLPPDLAEMDERRGKQARALLKQNLMGPLSFRIPLFDPWAFLRATLPLVRPLISPFGLLLWLGLMIWAGLGALAAGPQIAAAVADQVWTASSIGIGVGVYVVMKAVHELGHGWVARRYGAEVREIGVMFLVFVPVPYVEASEAAALPSRFQRAAVSAAGIIVETTFAAVAFLLWQDMEPGPARAVAFNVMLIGGLSTILVNGNPLLKFDGYFVMIDLLGLPNLAQRATKWWGDLTQGRIFGAEGIKPRPDTASEKLAFALYAPLAFGYRIILSLTIAAYVAGTFFIVGVLLAIWSLTLSLGKPIGKAVWHLFTAPILHRVRRRAIAVTSAAMGIVLALLFVVPMPYSTMTQAVVWAGEGTEIRSGAAGQIVEVLVEDGTILSYGDPVLRLADPLAETRLQALEWRVVEQTLALASEQARDQGRAQLSQIALEAAQRDLVREQARANARVIRAATDGIFAPGLPVPDLIGRYLPQGIPMGDILRPDGKRLRIIIAQDQIGAVQGGIRRIELRLPHRVQTTTSIPVPDRSLTSVNRLPSAILGLSRGGVIATDPTDPDGLQTLARVFVLEAELPAALSDAPQGSRAHVRLVHDPRAPGLRLTDWLRQQFLRGLDV